MFCMNTAFGIRVCALLGQQRTRTTEELAPKRRGEAGSTVWVPIHQAWNVILILNNESDLRVAVALAFSG